MKDGNPFYFWVAIFSFISFQAEDHLFCNNKKSDTKNDNKNLQECNKKKYICKHT